MIQPKSRISILLILVVLISLASCRHEIDSTGGTDQPERTSVSQESFLPHATPDAQGIDSSALEQSIEAINNGSYGQMDSLILIRNGHIVSENYFREYTGEEPHRLYSVSKSITSLLIGIAIDKGYIDSLDQKLLDFFPEYERGEILNWDDRKADITLEDLLTMRAGFEWDEWSSPYTTPENDTTPLFNSSDWMKHMLDLPMAHTPGTQFTYNSGVTMLLSGILRNSTGMTAYDFASEYLFEPLEIADEDFLWASGRPESIFNTGWGIYMRSIDMAKIGYLVLNNGVWNGERIVSSEWLRASTSVHVQNAAGRAYGYQWWLLPQTGLENHTPTRNDIWYAGGWGGQFIVVVPLLDMVVVMNAENYTNVPPRGQLNDLLPQILNATGPIPNTSGALNAQYTTRSLQMGCDVADVKFKFQGDPPTTPAIPHGPSNRWDGKYINPGAVTFHDGQFHMFINGFHNWPGVISIGYFTSEDGVTWEAKQEDPVWRSTSVSYARPGLDVSSVIVEDDGTWVMYFHTVNSSQSWEIGRATAPSPFGPWTANPAPVLSTGQTGSFDSIHVKWPSVLKTSDGYVMYYGGQSQTGNSIGRASSDDGIHWTKDPVPVLSPASSGWDAGTVDRPEVQKTPDGYVMIYQGGNQLNNRGLATSTNGIDWNRFEANPIITGRDFPRGGTTSWDTALLHTNDAYYYYMEQGSLASTDIFVAIHEGSFCQE